MKGKAWSRKSVSLNAMVEEGALELLNKLAIRYESDIGSLISEAVYEYYEEERKEGSE